MQIHKSEFRSAITCARTVYRTEGLGAFYISYPTTLTMTVPFTAVQFTVYEQLKSFLNPSGAYSPATHIVAGGLSGAVAGAVTTPLDVAKTILQTRGTSHDAEIRNVRGLADAFRIIWQRDGLKGFARGLSPRVLTFMPSNALCWLSYEFFSTSPPAARCVSAPLTVTSRSQRPQYGTRNDSRRRRPRHPTVLQGDVSSLCGGPAAGFSFNVSHDPFCACDRVKRTRGAALVARAGARGL